MTSKKKTHRNNGGGRRILFMIELENGSEISIERKIDYLPI